MILLIDNYDSFSYNLYQLLGSYEPEIRVVRNDALTVEEIAALKPAAIVLSPGPGRPEKAGRCLEIVQKLGKTQKILGVCLGHQAICEAYGAEITYAKELKHGKASMTALEADSRLFFGLSAEITTARYHSLVVAEETLPARLKVTARAADGEIMAVEDRNYPVFGVQFHPESIMTPEGAAIIRNFLTI